MSKAGLTTCLAAACMMAVAVARADSFGTFDIDFVTISGDASSANGTNISGYTPGHSYYKTFTDPSNSYRMGTYEITNAQWNKFKAAYGTVAGTPADAYDTDSAFTGTNVPTNNVSWYEAAQFVNWLNTSSGKSAAYKFIGTQGKSDYTLGVWSVSDAGYNAANPYRNSNAFYFLPTENEWVKAAYWNGTALQTYATKAGQSLYQGNGSNGGWNYDYSAGQPWNVGSGSQELNGTYDMMGNIWEWMESPSIGDYLPGSNRGQRGGSCGSGFGRLSSSSRSSVNPSGEYYGVGFRVASVPEPCSLTLLCLGGLAMRYRKR